jgi:acyl-CoA thioester hydrolase
MATPLLTHRLIVRFRDCDAFGHVNNAVYFTYLEEARAALWRAIRLTGFEQGHGSPRMDSDSGHGSPRMDPGSGLQMQGVSVIVARAECDFRLPARFGDVLEVRLSLEAMGRTSFTYEYEIVGVPEELPVAAGRTVQVLYDYTERRPVEIPEPLRARLSRAPEAG